MNQKTKRFITKATNIHSSSYIYDLVEYVSVDAKVAIICPIHGLFEQTPRLHLYKKSGCNKCVGDRQRNAFTKPFDLFEKEAKLIHNETYSYDRASYSNATTKMSICCPIHGVFKQTPSSHLRGNGCKKCADDTKRVDIGSFVDRSNNLHDHKYSYEYATYTNGRNQITVTCPKHGVFSQRAESHLQGVGCPSCKPRIRSSRGEQEIVNYIESLGFDTQRNTYDLIPPTEIDIFVPSRNLAIELNGVYWHSELAGKTRMYHQEKTQRCNDAGIRLLHVYDCEWNHSQYLVKSRISSVLGTNKRVYARSCKVVSVSANVAREFLGTHHMQGHVNGSVNLALLVDDTLVAVMTFGKSRFSQDWQWELLRFCSSMGVTVVGGASKLFSYFVRTQCPESIISYSDRRWNSGGLYITLGMQYLRTSSPNYHYFKDSRVLESRMKYQKHKQRDCLELFDCEKSEWENMLINGYNRIWDCGNDVFGIRY